MHLIKFWFSVSREEQRRRFREREKHPLKQWKLSPVDIASLDKWDEYTEAKKAMFVHTDTVEAPWTVIKSDCKKRARLNAIRYVLHKLPYTGKEVDKIGPLDPLLVGRGVRRVRDRRARTFRHLAGNPLGRRNPASLKKGLPASNPILSPGVENDCRCPPHLVPPFPAPSALATVACKRPPA